MFIATILEFHNCLQILHENSRITPLKHFNLYIVFFNRINKCDNYIKNMTNISFYRHEIMRIKEHLSIQESSFVTIFYIYNHSVSSM